LSVVGTPCWVEAGLPDLRRAAAFYGALFGWETRGGVARLAGRAVAGLGPAPSPGWITRVRVASVGDAVARALRAGGTLVTRAGRHALLADPAGARFAVGEIGGAELVNEPGSWDLSTLHTPDPGGAEAFYGALFGWRAEPFGQIALWRLPDHAGGVDGQPVPRDTVAIMAHGDAPARWSVDFRVHDAVAVARLAVRLGAALLDAPHDVPGFRTAALADPQGAAFTVTQFTWA
jgi:predicted enzyme related to lactoylglutathione lyase